jgi:hypothetical protein
MTRTPGLVLAVAAAAVIAPAMALPACDDARKQECDALLSTMKPLDVGTPSRAAVDGVSKAVGGLKLQNQTLAVYATNYKKTLAVLSGTLELEEGGSAPDGTDAVIKENLAHARTDRDDVQRFCSK